MRAFQTISLPSGIRVFLMDSISYITDEAREQVVVSGSHGGSAAARYAIEVKPLLVVFNDAGVGKDRAGIAGLVMLQEWGVAAVAVAHTSARIGDAQDTWEHGVIAHVNARAAEIGLRPGIRVQNAIMKLRPTCK